MFLTSEDTVLVFYSCVTDYHRLSCLSTHIHYLVASGLRSLVTPQRGSLLQGLTAVPSSRQLGLQTYQVLAWGGAHFQTPPPQGAGRISLPGW